MIPHHLVDGSGDAVVLINALGATVDMWEPQLERLTERFRTVRFDMRGHGSTQVDPGRWTIDDLADDVLDLYEGLGLERAHIVGVSMGGAIAMRLAVRNPERIGHLVLVSTAAKLGTSESWRERAETVLSKGCEAISGAAMDRWFTESFHAEHPEVVAAFRERFEACDRGGYAACCEALGLMDQRDEIDAIAAPTLVMVGSEDEVISRADAEFLAERIGESRLVVAEGAKHLLTTEHAEWFNRQLLDFLEL